MRTIAAISLSGGQGKTTCIFFLGLHLALAGQRVLWVDADPQTNLTFYSGVRGNERGLAGVLRGKTNVEDAIYPLSWGNLFILPAGEGLFDLNEYLANSGNCGGMMRKRLRGVGEWFDYCLIDSPPSRSQIVITAVGASDVVFIPAEATVKGTSCVLETMGMLEAMRDLEIWRGEILGVVPFRDRWIGYSQCRDARENLAVLQGVGTHLFASILESEQYKRALRAGKTLSELGHSKLDRPFMEILERLGVGVAV